MSDKTIARETRNLWHRKDGPYSRETYRYTGPCLFSHRGVEVFKGSLSSWDYVLGDATITQRAGFSPDKAPAIIDGLLDGGECCSDAVAAHLRAHGFSPLSYSEYGKNWQQIDAQRA